MALSDQLTSPAALRALLSWRGPAAVVIAIVCVVVGLPWPAALGIGAVLYGGLVAKAVAGAGPSRTPASAKPDPFTVGEPWRRFVQDAERAQRKLAGIVGSVKPGPIRDRLGDIAGRIDRAAAESYAIAQRGHALDQAVIQIDPVRLRSRHATLLKQRDALPDEARDTGNIGAAIESVESQLTSADRLKQQSAATADRLRLSQARLDELVARATEVALGTTDTETYEHDVDSLVTELEGLRLAIDETNAAAAPFRIDGFGMPGTSGTSGAAGSAGD